LGSDVVALQESLTRRRWSHSPGSWVFIPSPASRMDAATGWLSSLRSPETR
jgi:hypothetical protein